jgi:hypothetical protein
MGAYSEAFGAFDVSKKKHVVAIAEAGRTDQPLRKMWPSSWSFPMVRRAICLSGTPSLIVSVQPRPFSQSA